jgi:hypothetical protein
MVRGLSFIYAYLDDAPTEPQTRQAIAGFG